MLAETKCPNEEIHFGYYGLIDFFIRVTILRLGHPHHLVPHARDVLHA